MILKWILYIGWQGIDRIHLFQDMDKRQALVNVVMNLLITQNTSNLLTRCETASFSRRTGLSTYTHSQTCFPSCTPIITSNEEHLYIHMSNPCVSESHPGCHGYNKTWFVHDVSDTSVAHIYTVSTKTVHQSTSAHTAKVQNVYPVFNK
jgi:hypothetical protein